MNLIDQKCVPCEGGVPAITGEQAGPYLAELPDWRLNESGTAIARKLNTKTFDRGVEAITIIAKIADAEQHHPDLHLTGYRHLRIELTTHAIGGLSENDFILAAKIDAALTD